MSTISLGIYLWYLLPQVMMTSRHNSQCHQLGLGRIDSMPTSPPHHRLPQLVSTHILHRRDGIRHERSLHSCLAPSLNGTHVEELEASGRGPRRDICTVADHVRADCGSHGADVDITRVRCESKWLLTASTGDQNSIWPMEDAAGYKRRRCAYMRTHDYEYAIHDPYL